MKKILFLFLTAILLVGCQNNNKTSIQGTVMDPAFEGKMVFLKDTASVNLDSAIIRNGNFSIKTNSDSSSVRILMLDERIDSKNDTEVAILLESGTIRVAFDTIAIVTGTPVNQTYTDYRLKIRDISDKMRALSVQYNEAASQGAMNDSLDAQINQAYDALASERLQLSFDFVKNNISNSLGRYVFATKGQMFDSEQQKQLLALTDDAFKKQASVQKMIRRLENEERVSIGKKFVEFTLKDPSGNDVSLSDYAGKGKYVLIDFWASWCPPCREEMPNVVKAYAKYKNKGFEIVGVSLDKDHDAWVKGIKDLNITWPQMSDVKFWDSQVVDLYAIDGIPHTVLLDKEGIIIAKDLRGDELDRKLSELLQ